MQLAINVRMESDVAVIYLSGRLTVLEYSLRDTMQELLEKGHRRFRVDGADLSYVDSFGLGQLVSAFVSIMNKGGEFAIARPSERLRELLRITKLDTVFPIATDKGAAPLQSSP